MKRVVLVLVTVLASSFCTDLAAAPLWQQTSLDEASEALRSSDFLAASEAAGGIQDAGKRARMRMDVQYAAGDMAGALLLAERLMELGSESPHGAFMATRLALDLALLDRGQSSLGVFQERLRESRGGMPLVTYDWYAARALELEGQASMQALQASEESAARRRSKIAIGVAALAVMVFLAGANRKVQRQPAL